MNTRVRQAVLQVGLVPQASLPGRPIHELSAEQRNAKKTQLVARKNSCEVRLVEIKNSNQDAVANRYRVGKKNAPNTAAMEQRWNQERVALVSEIKSIEATLSVIKTLNFNAAKLEHRSFEQNFWLAAKTVLDANTYAKIIEVAKLMQ